MRGLELRKGTMDLVVNDLAPGHRAPARAATPRCRSSQSPGVDYQYIGLNLRDPVLQDVRVRQALAYAIDRQAIVDYLRRGLADAGRRHAAAAVVGVRAGRRLVSATIPRRRAALLDEAGYPRSGRRRPGAAAAR